MRRRRTLRASAPHCGRHPKCASKVLQFWTGEAEMNCGYRYRAVRRTCQLEMSNLTWASLITLVCIVLIAPLAYGVAGPPTPRLGIGSLVSPTDLNFADSPTSVSPTYDGGFLITGFEAITNALGYPHRAGTAAWAMKVDRANRVV